MVGEVRKGKDNAAFQSDDSDERTLVKHFDQIWSNQEETLAKEEQKKSKIKEKCDNKASKFKIRVTKF